MSFELDAGYKLLSAVFTHKLFITNMLADVTSESFQLFICLWTPLTPVKGYENTQSLKPTVQEITQALGL